MRNAFADLEEKYAAVITQLSQQGAAANNTSGINDSLMESLNQAETLKAENEHNSKPKMPSLWQRLTATSGGELM